MTSLGELPALLGPDVYAVHTDHDAFDIVEALEAILPTGPRFIGLVGSRLVRARINFVEDFPFLDVRAVLEVDLLQVAAHARPHLHGIDRRGPPCVVGIINDFAR